MQMIPAKTILSGWSDGSSWFGGNYNMNIYKGCCHGCIYCDSRSECYQIENFDTIRAKENALEIIERNLKSKRKTGIVITGSMSDPYNPFEQEYKLTRGALKLIDRYQFGIIIDTKSDLVIRDVDLLLKIKEHSPVAVNLTITTADDGLCRKIEQHVVQSSKRFEAIRKLSDAGIKTGILLMPILPFINDSTENIETIVRKAHENGARWIYPGFGVTLRMNQRDFFYQKVNSLFPGIERKYERAFGSRYYCNSPNSEMLWKVFTAKCNEFNLLFDMKKIIESIRKEYRNEQLNLFNM